MKIDKEIHRKFDYRRLQQQILQKTDAKLYDINEFFLNKTSYTKKSSSYSMTTERNFDIDNNFNWKQVKFILKNNYNEISK